MQNLTTWLVYISLVTFATYWLSNLLLWYPWSYDTTLGMTLMLSVMPLIWIYAVFHCLKRFPKPRLIYAAIYTSTVFTLMATLLDFVFFGIIRNAMSELYHATTLYGYAFLIALPFAESYFFKRRLVERSRMKSHEFRWVGFTGLICFMLVAIIISFDLTLSEGTFRFVAFILASIVVFNMILWIVVGGQSYRQKILTILSLTGLCVVLGMLIGKFGSHWGLPWWIYYTLPLLMTLFIPPWILKMNRRQILIYLLLSFISAPFIHAFFSFFFGWNEYMPFLEIPYFRSMEF